MEKTTLSVLAFCLGAAGVARADEMVDLQTLRVLGEQRISPEEYERLAGPAHARRSIITGSNYDSNSGILTSANYDSNSGILTSANYDSNSGIVTAANYDSNSGILTAGNYSTVPTDPAGPQEQMPSPIGGE